MPELAHASTLQSYFDAEEAFRLQILGVIDTIALTLTTLYPDAAYLVVEEGEYDWALGLTGIYDARGRLIVDFAETTRLAELPASEHEIRALWRGFDPADPVGYQAVLATALAHGGVFEEMPSLPDPDAPADVRCVHLAPAEPSPLDELWLLRPTARS